jgi:hypothetical protein
MPNWKPWLRRLSLVGVVLLPSFMATCSSGMSSLQINVWSAPSDAIAGPRDSSEIRAA